MTSLRRRMLEDMQVRCLSPATQERYVQAVARFARHFGRSPTHLGPEEIRAYQVYLTTERRLAPSWLVVASSALRFLYHVTLKKDWTLDDVIPWAKRRRSLPVVLSPGEVAELLDAVHAVKHRAILTTCYAAGLRISEALHLTVSAIDSRRMVLHVANGKGQRDRYVMLSPKLLTVLRHWWQVERPRHWLFPGARPETPMTRRTVYLACRRAGTPGTPQQARLSTRAPPRVRRPSARGRHRPAHDSAPARPPGAADDRTVPARRDPNGLLDHESVGPAPAAHLPTHPVRLSGRPCRALRSPWRRSSAATATLSAPRSEPPSRRRSVV